jgi:hypothetical protein
MLLLIYRSKLVYDDRLYSLTVTITRCLQVPSCHVVGHQDWVKQHAIDLARQFQNPIVIMHPKGHVIPRLQDPHLASLKAFLRSFMPLAKEKEQPEGLGNTQLFEGQEQQAQAAGVSGVVTPLRSRL